MSDTNLLYIAILVFVLMLVGLVLTALEFRNGAPRRQEREAHASSRDPEARPL